MRSNIIHRLQNKRPGANASPSSTRKRGKRYRSRNACKPCAVRAGSKPSLAQLSHSRDHNLLMVSRIFVLGGGTAGLRPARTLEGYLALLAGQKVPLEARLGAP
jgi:hypothetical protein